MANSFRKSLKASALIESVFKRFSRIQDPRNLEDPKITMADHLMSGFAVFSLKFPSLLEYDRRAKDSVIKKNLKSLFHVQNPPSDTYLRERLDEINPALLRPVFKMIFSKLQRGKGLEPFHFMDGYYLISLDGTGEFFSNKVSCSDCCRKEHKNGKVSFYHQMLGACIVHPGQANVIPLCPEAIKHQDGHTKNDCERNASKRFIENLKREHPHLKAIIIEDGLASNAPHLELLQKHGMHYIIGAKPGDHKFLFDSVENSKSTVYHEFKDKKGHLHQFRFLNQVSLNKSNPDLKINFLEYRETTSKGKSCDFSWVTDITITPENVFQLMRGARARWKIENETFNTLKNLGYNFGHNYGHGKQYLATIFSMMMALAFLIDQVQLLCCNVFQTLKKRVGTYRGLWERMRVFFEYTFISSWEEFYQFINKEKMIDTS